MNAKTAKTGNGHGSNEPRVLSDESKQNIRLLGKGEKPRVEAVVVSDDRVEYHYEVGGGSAVGPGKAHQAFSVLDYSECTREDLLKLACRPVIIALQRRWNTVAKSDLQAATQPGTFAYVNVKRDIIDSQRQAVAPLGKVNKAMSKMSAEDKAKLLAQLQAELEAE